MAAPDVAIITAIYDHYDSLKPVPAQDGAAAECVVVTDDPALEDRNLGWRVIYAPAPAVTPMRAAKAAKFRPWEFTAAPASIWIDASCRVTSATFAVDFLAAAAGTGLATFRHRFWDCAYTEASVSASMPKYDGEPVGAQAAAYRAEGFPEHWGLWETTILARRHTAAVRALGGLWAAEMGKWSCQDQVSFPYALKAAGLRPGRLPGGQDGSPWHVYEGSARHDDRMRV